MSRLTFEDETGDGDIVLDGTDSDSTDVGDNIVSENGIDFSNKNVTITDSSGASGTIIKADIATASSSVATTSTTVGEYSGIRSLLGEDLNRIQDSFTIKIIPMKFKSVRFLRLCERTKEICSPSRV